MTESKLHGSAASFKITITKLKNIKPNNRYRGVNSKIHLGPLVVSCSRSVCNFIFLKVPLILLLYIYGLSAVFVEGVSANMQQQQERD